MLESRKKKYRERGGQEKKEKQTEQTERGESDWSWRPGENEPGGRCFVRLEQK